MDSNNPISLLEAAISENSLDKLKEAIKENNTVERFMLLRVSIFIKAAFHRSIAANRPEFVDYLFFNYHSYIDLKDPMLIESLWESVDVPLLEILVPSGWDINQKRIMPADYECNRLVYSQAVLENYDCLVWMVRHGAMIFLGDTENKTGRNPTLLETCAASGSVESMKFLVINGVKLSKKTLHQAAITAAALGADPYDTSDVIPADIDPAAAKEMARKHRAAAMLRYVVDELKPDINAVMTCQPYLPGTPVSLAVRMRYGTKVVKWLLDKGADPTTSSPNILDSAEWFSIQLQNRESFLDIQKWKERKRLEDS